MADPLTLTLLAASTGLQVFGLISGGKAAEETAKLDAFNIDTQKLLSKTEALQRHNDRLAQYKFNTKANIAAFYAAGRDVGSDKSVAAFLSRQKEIASQDAARSDLMGYFEQMKLAQQAATTRIEGRSRRQAANISAITSLVKGASQYNDSRQGPKGVNE